VIDSIYQPRSGRGLFCGSLSKSRVFSFEVSALPWLVVRLQPRNGCSGFAFQDEMKSTPLVERLLSRIDTTPASAVMLARPTT